MRKFKNKYISKSKCPKLSNWGYHYTNAANANVIKCTKTPT